VADLRRATRQAIAEVTDAMDGLRFNSAVAQLMTLTNALSAAAGSAMATPAWDEAVEALLLLAAPIAPHIAEELWYRRGRAYSVHQARWPADDAALLASEPLTIVVQVDGVVRARLSLPAGTEASAQRRAALAEPAVTRLLAGRDPARVVVVPGRLVNVVTRPGRGKEGEA
jgi:leucyl-tRNA synthetase